MIWSSPCRDGGGEDVRLPVVLYRRNTVTKAITISPCILPGTGFDDYISIAGDIVSWLAGNFSSWL
jgi:hypothetical protein